MLNLVIHRKLKFLNMENKVQVELNRNRFLLFAEYDQALFKLLKKIEKCYWDGKTRVWSLPIESYGMLLAYLKQRNMDVEVCDSDVNIWILKVL